MSGPIVQEPLSPSLSQTERRSKATGPKAGARSPQKILYLSASAALGGAELVLLDLMATLRRERPDWRLGLLLGASGPLAEEAERLGVACEVRPWPDSLASLGDAGLGERTSRLALAARLARSAPSALAALVDWRRAIRREAPDWVHANGMKALFLSSWATPKRTPLVWHLHDYLGSRAVMSRLLRIAARRSIQGVAVSDSIAEDAVGVVGPNLSIQTIYNAVDLERFHPGPADSEFLDQAAGLPKAPPGTLRVGLLATFARWKGQDVFLEAVAKLPADRACRFYIVGGPIYQTSGSQWSIAELQARAEALGLSDRVGFTGFQDPARALRALDVVVHASTRPEPFGRVIVEAMATARPVVAIAGGGSSELFEDGIEALGVPPGDPDAMAVVLDRLIQDPDLRSRLAQAGRRAAETRFNRETWLDPWVDLYERMKNESENPRP